ncbi:unnamed protein product [Merluccius merluccius]
MALRVARQTDRGAPRVHQNRHMHSSTVHAHINGVHLAHTSAPLLQKILGETLRLIRLLVGGYSFGSSQEQERSKCPHIHRLNLAYESACPLLREAGLNLQYREPGRPGALHSKGRAWSLCLSPSESFLTRGRSFLAALGEPVLATVAVGQAVCGRDVTWEDGAGG